MSNDSNLVAFAQVAAALLPRLSKDHPTYTSAEMRGALIAAEELIQAAEEFASNGAPQPKPSLAPMSADEEEQVNAIADIYPKRRDPMLVAVAVRMAIKRHGFQKVYDGTKAVVEADARRGNPRGFYLPNPVDFFTGDRFLEDPAIYGPRTPAAPNPGTIRMDLVRAERDLARLHGELGMHDAFGFKFRAGADTAENVRAITAARNLVNSLKSQLAKTTESLPK